jgi:cytoskeletal protein RodZ
MAVFGDTLRQARAHKGVTLKEAEQATRISRHHLLALEEEQFDELPPLIYQRGIVRNYATYLSLDPNKLLSMFETARGGSADEPPLVAPTAPLDMPSHWAPNFAIIAFLVVMSAVVFAWMYSAYFAPDGPTSTPTELIPTVTAVEGDTIYLPSATAVPPTPTATPEPTATPSPTEEPVVTEDQSTADSGTADTDTLDDVEDATATSEPTEATSGALTFNFVATGYLDSLQIVADGSVVVDGPLEAGGSTDYLSADVFQVYVSDPSSLEIVRENGDSFTMGDTYFELP